MYKKILIILLLPYSIIFTGDAHKYMSIRGIVDRMKAMAGPVSMSSGCQIPAELRRLFFCQGCCAYTVRPHTCGGDTVTCLGCKNRFDGTNNSITRHLLPLKTPQGAKGE